jgi:hypothetical protein
MDTPSGSAKEFFNSTKKTEAAWIIHSAESTVGSPVGSPVHSNSDDVGEIELDDAMDTPSGSAKEFFNSTKKTEAAWIIHPDLKMKFKVKKGKKTSPTQNKTIVKKASPQKNKNGVKKVPKLPSPMCFPNACAKVWKSFFLEFPLPQVPVTCNPYAKKESMELINHSLQNANNMVFEQIAIIFKHYTKVTQTIKTGVERLYSDPTNSKY